MNSFLLVHTGPRPGPSTGQVSDEGEIMIQAHLGIVFISYVIFELLVD